MAAGGLLAAAIYLPKVPHAHAVDLKLDDPATITSVELSWAPRGGEAMAGASWRFEAGKAPGSLPSTVSLPDGRYELEIDVSRGAEREAVHRQITLGEAERITVRLH